MARDRKKMREALLKRTEESHERRKDSGRFGTFFRDDVEEVTYFKCTAAEHLIDIIPYIAGGNDPNVPKGEDAYGLDIWVHGGVGVNEDSFICLARTYHKSCPICEQQRKLKDEGAEDDVIIAFNPTRRTVYNIICYDDEKEKAKGIQVWAIAHRYMERLLTPLAKKRSGGRILFTDPDEGKSISFERQGMTQFNTDYIGHKFEDRDYKITDAILDAAHCLDELIHVPTEDEVRVAFWGEVEEKVEKEPEEETIDSSKETEKEEVEEKKSEKETIAVKRERRRIEKAKKEKGKVKCPGGGEFGADLDTLSHCDACEKWDDCAKKADEIEEEERLK